MLEQLKSYVDRASDRQRAFRQGRSRTLYSIYHHQNGMKLSWSLGMERGGMVLAWEDTTCITAFKRDLYTVDLICLEVRLKENKTVELNEDMDGWESLVGHLPIYLPGCKNAEQWFETVAFPAFKPRLTVIYRREKSDQPHQMTYSPRCPMFL